MYLLKIHIVPVFVNSERCSHPLGPTVGNSMQGDREGPSRYGQVGDSERRWSTVENRQSIVKNAACALAHGTARRPAYL